MLDLLVPSKVRRRVLAFLVNHADGEYYIREMERAIGSDFRSVHLELARLEKAGILRSRRVANLKYYRVNQTYYLYPELRSIIEKMNGEEGTQRPTVVL
jgi:DNA-binding transcriptional ArsR family regulator